jgi:FAD synthetase
MSLTAVLPRATTFALRHPDLNPAMASAAPSFTSIMPSTPSSVIESDPSPLRHICLDIRRRVDALLNDATSDPAVQNVQRQTRASLAVIEEALKRYPYASLFFAHLRFRGYGQLTNSIRLHALSLSYNGGKDCLVLLILYLAGLAKYPQPLPQSLRSIYIVSKDPFPQVESFVVETSRKYHLDLLRLERDSMRTAFAEYLQEGGPGSDVKAILVGTRRTDPHGAELGSFSPTDGKWPAFMRVNAVIDWKLRDIWAVSLSDHFYAKCSQNSLFDISRLTIANCTIRDTQVWVEQKIHIPIPHCLCPTMKTAGI